MLRERGLFVRPVFFVFRLYEAEIGTRPSDGARMVDKKLDKELALIRRTFDTKIGIMRGERRHAVAHDELVCNRAVVDAAHSGEIGLHEFERTLPALRREIADGIEPAIDRIEAAVLFGPHLAKPELLLVRDREDFADARILEIKMRQPLQRLDQIEADMVHVSEL